MKLILALSSTAQNAACPYRLLDPQSQPNRFGKPQGCPDCSLML
jgi:hypothetical protein